MSIIVVDLDRDLSASLAKAAQKLGHRLLVMPDRASVFGALPFSPSALIAAAERVDSSLLAYLARVNDAYPQITTMVAVEKAYDEEVAAALRAGVHDVISIPFNPYILLLRLSTWLARSTGLTPDVVRIADLEVDIGNYSARKHGRPVNFTKLELRLLFCLMQHSPRLAPIERLLVFGWDGAEYPDPGLLKTHISHIRKKLRVAQGERIEILARHTLGYVLRHDDAGVKAPN